MLEKTFKIINPTGMDAKVSSNVVSNATKYQSVIKLHLNNIVVDLKSIMGVMSLNVYKGEYVKIVACGLDEELAINELTLYITQNKIGKEL